VAAVGALEARFFFGGEVELRALRVGVSLGRPITPALHPASFSAARAFVLSSRSHALHIVADARSGDERWRHKRALSDHGGYMSCLTIDRH
jgi:hypothetical protein